MLGDSDVIRHSASLIPYAIIALEELRVLAASDVFPENLGMSPGAPALQTACGTWLLRLNADTAPLTWYRSRDGGSGRYA